MADVLTDIPKVLQTAGPLVTALFGFIASLIGGTVSPLVKWGLERRRRREERRRELIEEWRTFIGEVIEDKRRSINEDDFDLREKYPVQSVEAMLRSRPEFHSMVPHLSEETLQFIGGEKPLTSEEGRENDEGFDLINEALEKRGAMKVSTNFTSPVLQLVLAEITQQEKEWGLR